MRQADVIVVGGGHAGTEAALAAARTGADTLLLTQSIDTIGQMSCNPAIGGIGKSHLVREIDALGGAMAQAADRAGIHFRTLNSRKGPAVRATRAQADRALYKAAIRQTVEAQPGLRIEQQTVADLIVEGEQVAGIITASGRKVRAQAVVLTVGTFLGGVIHIGMERREGGRAGDAPANALAARLRELPFTVGRLKTGTPPRIDGSTVHFAGLDEQPGDQPRPVMSFMSDGSEHPRQVPCHITHTNPRTHELIRASLDQSPLYGGVIEGVGPRYCPSIEDKVVRFADKPSHQIFIEPEGLGTRELYPNGISTSLPLAVQEAMVQSIKGFERAQLTRPGYAIEYDFFEPQELAASLETRHLKGLYFAGQINGTTGYEEAAAQGLIAGLNAARQTRGQPPWCPARSQAYIGVLIDDLITLGTKEPYRMFTSRAEYRLSLRQDNADRRLTETGRALGLVDDARWAAYNRKAEAIAALRTHLETTRVGPGRLSASTEGPLTGDATGAALASPAALSELGVPQGGSYGSGASGYAPSGSLSANAVGADGSAAQQRPEQSSGASAAPLHNSPRRGGVRQMPKAFGGWGGHDLATLVGPLTQRLSLAELLRRPEVRVDALMAAAGLPPEPPQVAEQVEIDIKYQGYLKRQEAEIALLASQESLALPRDLDYAAIKGLSTEAKQKLASIRPETLGQAGRIPGLTPAALSLLLLHLKKRQGAQAPAQAPQAEAACQSAG